MKFKKVRVYYNGKRLNDIYAGYTWFQVFVHKAKIYFRTTVIIGLVGVLGWIGYNIYKNPVHGVYTAEAKEVQVDKLLSKVENMKHGVVTTIQNCEKAQYSEDDGIIIFDTNNKASIGTLQFQKSTVIHYYKTLYDKDITPKEAVLIALDDEKAESLAYDIIFKNEKGWSNWYNCGKKHGVEQTLKVIKELES